MRALSGRALVVVDHEPELCSGFFFGASGKIVKEEEKEGKEGEDAQNLVDNRVR